MSDEVTVSVRRDPPDWMRQAAERQAREAEFRPANKAALFEALARLGVADVIVGFDGAGDSGQIESVEARDPAGRIVDLPDIGILIRQVACAYGGADDEARVMPLAEAIETLAYDWLEQVHDGWEINEGADGEFVFDVAGRTIRLEYNERYEASTFHEHEF